MAACNGGSTQTLSQHLQVVVKFCSEQEFVKAEAIGLETLSVEFSCAKNIETYHFNFTADYPDNTIVSCSHDSANVQQRSLALPALFSEICKAWCSSYGQTLPSLPFELCSPSASLADLQRQITSGSTMSAASSEYTEGSDIFSDDMDYYDDTGSTTDSVHCLLERDIARVAEKYGQNAVDHRIHAGINEMDVILYIDLGFLDSYTASAWNVNTDQPVVIQIHLQGASDYLDGPTPTVEVYQGTIISKKKFGLGGQIQKIMATFLNTQWRNMSNRQLQEHMDTVAARRRVKQTEDITTPTNPRGALFFNEAFLPQGNLPCDQETTPTVSQKDPLGCATEGEQSLATPSASQKDPLGCVGAPPTTEEIPSLGRQDSHGAQIVLPSGDRVEDSKTLPPLDDGFLAQFLQYALNRIPLLNEFCVICDERHVLETGLIRPCVCTRELCVFAFQTLFVMSDSAESIATDGSVVDLLIAMANAAANSSRVQIILDPYPSIVDPLKRSELAMDPKEKDFKLVREVMQAIIGARKLYVRGKCTSASLKEVMDNHHHLAFSLMQWIVATNRSHIVMLPEEKQLPSMMTKYQFLLISSPPAKEAAFQQAKCKYGSTYAFHGSSIENWHSIMRQGLINASGTKYQVNGASYGKGIYLSPDCGTSFGYSSRYTYLKNSSTEGDALTLAGKTNINCIALCEVVTNKELRKSGQIWVCSNPDNVVTRFFFVYENMLIQNYPNTADLKFRKEIISALKK